MCGRRILQAAPQRDNVMPPGRSPELTWIATVQPAPGPFNKTGAGRRSVRVVRVGVLAAAICLILPIVLSALGISGKSILIGSASAQTKQKSPIDQARAAVETLINRLRGRDMPEGIVKSNGRLEATEVDVAANTRVGSQH